MRIVFLSNYFNHHQQPLAEAINRINGGDFYFIATTTMRQERRDLGYGMEKLPEYVLESWTSPENEARCAELIQDAEVVITGSAPESMLKNRIAAGKLIFRYSERPLKNGMEWNKYLPRLLRWHLRNPWGKPIYLLCSGAYVAGDYGKFGLFKNRAYKWGYFPEGKQYDSLPEKEENTILWCGRFLQLKHPDDVIRVAKRLREGGFSFRLQFIGAGEMERELRELVLSSGLEGTVSFLGTMKPEEVRTHMERAGIYLFTSDFHEGWGAVLNESMNSGCAVIASHAIGSVPFLLRDGENGLVYESGNTQQLYEKIRYLLEHPQEQRRLGQAAYDTVTTLWNPETAAQRLLDLAQRILDGEKNPGPYASGPCSKAKPIREDWYKG